MASWNNVTKTEQGLALEQKLLIQAKPLRLVAARSGAGKVNPTQLAKQTAVSDPKQTLELRPVYLSEENTATIPVMLSNAGLAEGYQLYQIGIYAEDPDGGEVLYIIAQTDIASGESVPSASESAGYSIDWNIAVKVSEASSIEVVVNEAGKLTLSQADALYVRAETLDALLDDKVDKEDGMGLSQENYTSADKEKVSKLPADTNAALAGKIDKEEGKGLSSNDFTDEYKAKLENDVAQNLDFEAVLTTTWNASYAPYDQTVSVPGILNTDKPIIDISASDSELMMVEEMEKEWAKVFFAYATNDQITFYAKEKTTQNLNLKIKVVR